MSGQACRLQESSPSEGPPAKSAQYLEEYNHTLNTAVWLKFNMADRDHMASPRCAVCTQFKDKLVLMHKFHPVFIEGTTSTQTSMLKEHAATSMHERAMGLFKKDLNSGENCFLNPFRHSNWHEQASQGLHSGKKLPARAKQNLDSGKNWFQGPS